MKIKFVLLLLLLFPLCLTALDCSVCNRRISGEYLKNQQGDAFCSKRCIATTFPKCTQCRRACEKGAYTLMEKVFCSQACVKKHFRCASCLAGMDNIVTMHTCWGENILICQKCSKGPPCYYCSIPGASVRLRDNRRICRKCRSTVVSNPDEVRKIFNQIRRNLAQWYGFDRMHVIQFRIVSIDQLTKLTGSIYRPENGRQMALMRYRSETIRKVDRLGNVKQEIPGKETCQIYVVYNVPKDMLIDALVHELTHDHLRHNVGKVKNLANEEGFCELVASLYNAKIGNGYLNKRKLKNPDKIYGDGFRKMRRIFLRNGRSLKRTIQYVK